ncbi:MAG: DUF922 domain-containing protein [Candidatus Thiodiazotropha sp. (ex Epidulcina cf. delphinae)]|nr:DUF922 domain-containing protein [Candidatus Thiodiazotropha sp. (ex Epidulcina cf. delphinae)]
MQSLKRACHSLGLRLALDHLGGSEPVNITLKEYWGESAMCETPSPARNNRPVPSGPSRDLPHAGFSSAQPVGAGASTAQAGPTLSGWPRQLAWSDFSDIQSRPRGESEDAGISIGFRPGRLTYEQENGEYRLGVVEFRMVLNQSGSWVVVSGKNATLLAHEQGHYDIVGLCYRDLVAEIRRLRGRSRRRLIVQVRRAMREHDQRADTLTRQYDSQQETDHGRNGARQHAWERQIRTCRQSGAQLTTPS